MGLFHKITTLAAVATLSASNVHASIFTISDERVRKKDISPTLGRGYSIMTDQYHSTCLMVDETTVPSYNYNCTYIGLLSYRRCVPSFLWRLTHSIQIS